MRIGQNTLLNAIKAAVLAADPKSIMPILGHVRLTAKDGRLTVSGTDLHVTAVATVACEGDMDILVPAKGLKDAVDKAFPKSKGRKAKDAVDPTVELTVDVRTLGEDDKAPRQYWLKVTGEGTFILPAMDPAEYPVLPAVDSKDAPTFYQTGRFLDALSYVGLAVPNNETRFHLNGACFAGTDIVSTDGHRLHRVSGLPGVPECIVPDGNGKTATLPGWIVPKRGIVALSKVAKGFAGDVVATWAWPFVRFTVGDVTVTAKCIDSPFPSYEQVIPKNNAKRLTIGRGALLSVLSSATPFTRDTWGVKVDAKPDHIVVSADNPDLGDFSQTVPANLADIHASEAPAHFVAGFNPRYLVEAVDTGDAADEPLTFQVDDDLGPIVLDTLADGGLVRTAVIMPMRI